MLWDFNVILSLLEDAFVVHSIELQRQKNEIKSKSNTEVRETRYIGTNIDTQAERKLGTLLVQ